jgi:hypothetical protein
LLVSDAAKYSGLVQAMTRWLVAGAMSIVAVVIAGCEDRGSSAYYAAKMRDYCEVKNYTESQCECAQAQMSTMPPEMMEKLILMGIEWQKNFKEGKGLNPGKASITAFERAGVHDREEQRKISSLNTEIIQRTRSLCSVDYKRFLAGLEIGSMYGDSYRVNLWRKTEIMN